MNSETREGHIVIVTILEHCVRATNSMTVVNGSLLMNDWWDKIN